MSKIHFDIIINGNRKDQEGNLIKNKRKSRPIGGENYRNVKSKFKSDSSDLSRLSTKRSSSNSKLFNTSKKLDSVLESDETGEYIIFLTKFFWNNFKPHYDI